ncbi:MAG: tRNA epoxyqueuosine(34) reductase QueG [Planctomycetota bacterium]|nr:tRNA epoxyqueuosine(34) reductase QueG [Planctomycetota bacterium]
MSPDQRSKSIKRAALALNFDRCGVAAAGSIPRSGFVREWLGNGYAGSMGYLHRHVESRIDIRTWLPWAECVIVVALNYHRSRPDADRGEGLTAESGAGDGLDIARGRVASYAHGEDYHVVLRERLEALLLEMRRMFPETFEARICVDTSAIIERELAAAAGVGWIGKNTMVLDPSLGSFFFLGEIVTDLRIAPDAPLPDHCGTCTRCLEACPTDAFPSPYVMDARRCISYLTIEHRGEIEPEPAGKMGDWVFGCDDCQTVCPFNSHAPESAESRFAGSHDDARPPLGVLIAESEADYKTRVRGKALDRAKYQMWKRNAEIAMRNQGSSGSASKSA